MLSRIAWLFYVDDIDIEVFWRFNTSKRQYHDYTCAYDNVIHRVAMMATHKDSIRFTTIMTEHASISTDTLSPRVAIIGGGLTGLLTATLLERASSQNHNHALTPHITIFEKSRSVGRLATRYRTDSDTSKNWQWAFGAQFFTAKTTRFQAFVAPWLDTGLLQPWCAKVAELTPASGSQHNNAQSPNIKTKEGKIYSINEGNLGRVVPGLVSYVNWCRDDHKESGRPYSARYIGSLVADFHRNLIKGGIYIYPATTAAPKGKLRLLYECAPMAFLAEQAGGLASDGIQEIMDIQVEELHQRVPLYIGSPEMVKTALKFLQE